MKVLSHTNQLLIKAIILTGVIGLSSGAFARPSIHHYASNCSECQSYVNELSSSAPHILWNCTFFISLTQDDSVPGKYWAGSTGMKTYEECLDSCEKIRDALFEGDEPICKHIRID